MDKRIGWIGVGRMGEAMAHPEVKERMNKLGADPFPLSVEAFNAFIRTEVDAAARIAKAANLKGP